MSKNTTKNRKDLYSDSGCPNFNPLAVAKVFANPENARCLTGVAHVRKSGETFFLTVSSDSSSVGPYFSCVSSSAAELFIACYETLAEIPLCKSSNRFFAAVIVSLVQSPRLTDEERGGFIEFFQTVEKCSGVSVHSASESENLFSFMNDFAF